MFWGLQRLEHVSVFLKSRYKTAMQSSISSSRYYSRHRYRFDHLKCQLSVKIFVCCQFSVKLWATCPP